MMHLLACAACHGKDGEGLAKNEYYPRLAACEYATFSPRC
jgi:cytochrome c553